MIASLGMYDFGPAMAANDVFWGLIRDRLRAGGLPAPEALTRGEAALWPTWTAPDLVLSQTCGYPYRARLHDKVSYIATPDYGVDGCPPGYYRSVFVARASDPCSTLAAFDGAAFAYNEPLSQSGWAGPQSHALRLGLRLIPTEPSGGHRRSAAAVAESRADLAAIDAVTWALMQDTDPAVAALKVIDHTDPTPGLPYIAAAGADAPLIRAALLSAFAALPDRHRKALHLKGFVSLAPAEYLAVANPPAPDRIHQPA